ncbi:hypothetical protein [Xanthomonas phage RTH11]|nr:hypothetical protein [Xanthomonas phage RTH11]
MPYFTVVAQDTRTGHSKTVTGVKAPNKFAAVDQVALSGNKNMVYDVWMTKHHKRNNRVRNWTKGRERHEVRAQGRPYWAVLARLGRGGHMRHIKSNGTMCYRYYMQMATDSWRDSSSFAADLLRQRLLSVKHMEALHE